MGGTVEFISPDGKERKVYPESEVRRKLAEGWTIADDGNIAVDTPFGRKHLPASQAEAMLGESGGIPSGVATAGEAGEDYRRDLAAAEYGDRPITAAAAKAAGTLTFGGSDALLTGTGLVKPETLEGLEEHNVGASLAGEFVPLIATALATGGTSLGAKAIQKTPAGWASLKAAQAGEKSTKAFIAANAAEGAAYGAGHAISRAAIHDEPLTAEHLAQGAAFGGGFGGLGATAFKAAGGIASKAKEKMARKGHALFDVTTEEGNAFLGQASKHMQDNLQMGDDLMQKTAPGANKITKAEQDFRDRWVAYQSDTASDLAKRLSAKKGKLGSEMDMPAMPKEVVKPGVSSSRIASLEDELDRAMKGPMGLGEQGPLGQRQRAETLRDYMAAKEAGDIPMGAPRHPDEVAAELKKARKALESQPSEAQYAKYQDDLATYEAKLAAVTEANSAVAKQVSAIDEATRLLESGRAGVDDILLIKREMLGDSAKNLRSFAKDAQKQLDLDAAIAERISTPVTKDHSWARDEYGKALTELRGSLGGQPTRSSIAKIMNGTPEEVERFRAAANRHYEAAIDLAQVSGDKAALKAAEDSALAMRKLGEESMTPEMREATKHLGMDTMAAVGLATDYALEGGPLDSVAKAATVVGMVRGRGGKKAKGMLGKVISSGGAGSARHLVKGRGLVAAGARTATGRLGYELTSGALGKVWSPERLFQASGRANSAITQAVQRMIKGTVKASMSGAGAKAALRAMQFNKDAEKRAEKAEDRLDELFKSKSEELIKFTGNPQQLAQAMYDDASDLRAAHPTLGDKAEVAQGRLYQIALDRMPKDPGTQHILGKSTWRPSDLQIQAYANVLTGLKDPIGTFDGITDGTISMEAAQAVRDGHPATFAALQMEVAKNADAIRENLSYEAQNRLSVFMGVPVNSTNTPEYRKFVAQHYTQEQTAQMEASKGVDANALLQGTPTQAQQLQKRGAK